MIGAEKNGETHLHGQPLSKGIRIGFPHIANLTAEPIVPVFAITEQAVPAERSRYRRAVARSRKDLHRMRTSLCSESAADAVQMIDSHIQMLEDPLVNREIEERITRERLNAEFILYSFATGYVERSGKSSHPFFQQRGREIFKLTQRVLGYLLVENEGRCEENTIIFVPELSLFDIARIEEPCRCAFLTQICGQHSHAALAARSRRIPLVGGIREEDLIRKTTREVIVDGDSGRVIFNPSPATLDYYQRWQQTAVVAVHRPETERALLNQTRDGLPITVTASITQREELADLGDVAAVGLVRTEMLLWSQQQLLFDEEGQCSFYAQLLQQVGARPVTFRLFDFGGDKLPQHFPLLAQQRNPLLGLRGSRFLLAHQQILVTQLRALLRASQGHTIQLLLPLITDVEEFERLRTIIDAVHAEISCPLPRAAVGCMIEVPAAALMVDRFLQHCQFLAIGSNDLAQYTLGVDRTMHHLYAPLHPSLLRMVKLICMQCQQQGTPLSICGEVGTAPQLLPLLIGLGMQHFCCPPAKIAPLQQAIRQLTLLQAIAVAEQALNLPTAAAVHNLLLAAEL